MSEARLADALARLDQNKELRLPLRSRDLLGRLALRFLWRRQVKWQIETNIASRDALTALSEIVHNQQQVPRAELAHEVQQLQRADQNITAGLNQRLYAAMGSIRTELGDLRLQLVDTGLHAEKVDQRLDAIESQLAELTAAARDARLRNAQVDLVLDRFRRSEGTEVEVTVPARANGVELAVAELLDGPVEHVRTARAAHLPVVEGRGTVFDAAPSRGEWFEVLREAGISVLGASANPSVVKHNAELGFHVEEADPLDALTRVDKRSLGAVTAFRFVERLSVEALSQFVSLAAESLRPGGVLLVESPVAGPEFHVDPFALRPVHPTYLRFLAETAGFAEVSVEQREHPLGARFTLTARM
ncbi:hypothetical protein [Lentzea flava]|uniref:Methyltransferase domain-containing protein n=1 Tax=Lentzea flava TaxID=103732 RepID=A0ABQ2UEB5_9PSEU|nr:hypothetical protein [Lentzea flava]MCP2197656.1 Methyltransferase domain [Lentzea flava]GGU21237.1 hypothetical protein GCM10010178_11810 [Lentzea flava]